MMLTKSAARTFFLVGTIICFGSFVLLTLDTFRRIPEQTKASELTEEVIRGKKLWETHNCMGCHTLLGEGAYYAPELTKVYERRGEAFIRNMLIDPAKMYPGERKMVTYNMNEQDQAAMVAFFRWIGQIDLNGFPAKHDLMKLAVPSGTGQASSGNEVAKPMIFNQMCLACHSLGGVGGAIGPALDHVGSRMTRQDIEAWLTDPLAVKPASKMPRLPLNNEDIKELAAFLHLLK